MVIVELTVAFLLILSSCNKNKVKMASTRLIQLLVGLIVLDTLTDQAKVDGIATLHNLSTLHQIVPLVITFGAPYALLQVISFCDKSSESAEKATTSSINGAIGVIVEAIEKGQGSVKSMS